MKGQANHSDLTVVIPAYRCAEFLPAAIASALRSPAVEIIIAENASGDSTLAVARNWRDRYPDRIRVLETPRTIPIVGANLNRGFREVRTPFAMRVDGDDVVLTKHISHAIARFKADQKLGIVSGLYTRIRANEYTDPAHSPADPDIPAEGYRQLSGLEAGRFVLGWDPSLSSSGTIFRMEAWNDAGGFDPTLTWGEDWELWFRIARRWSVGYFTSPVTLYRVNDSGLSSDHVHHDRLCFQYDYIYNAARRVWPEREMRTQFRKAFFRSARTYCGSALRAFERRRFADVPRRAIRGLLVLARAAAV